MLYFKVSGREWPADPETPLAPTTRESRNPTPRGETEMMTFVRSALTEMAYYRNDDLANQIVLCDEELSGVRTRTASEEELRQRLSFWLHLAAQRWLN